MALNYPHSDKRKKPQNKNNKKSKSITVDFLTESAIVSNVKRKGSERVRPFEPAARYCGRWAVTKGVIFYDVFGSSQLHAQLSGRPV